MMEEVNPENEIIVKMFIARAKAEHAAHDEEGNFEDCEKEDCKASKKIIERYKEERSKETPI